MRAKFVQPVAGATTVQRSTEKPVSFDALSRHVRVTSGPDWRVAVRLVGAVGVPGWAPTSTLIVFETESADIEGKPVVKRSPAGAPIAFTRYQYRLFGLTLVSVKVTVPVVVGSGFAWLNDTRPAEKFTS